MRLVIKNILIFLFAWIFVQSNSVFGKICIGFWVDGNITYEIKINSKRYIKEEEQKIPPKGMQFPSKNKPLFEVKFSKKNAGYTLKACEPIPETEELEIQLPENLSVTFEGNLKCKSLMLHESYRKQTAGTFINHGEMVFENLEIYNNITFKNNGNLTFKAPIILNLQKAFLVNNNHIQFKEEARLVGPFVNMLESPLVFSQTDGDIPLINEGIIIAKDTLALLCECYISEQGRIHSDQQIIIDRDKRNQNLEFTKSLDKEVPVKPKDKKFPVIDVIRIPRCLKEEKGSTSASLGEKTAAYFYTEFMGKQSFSHKSNNQENGFDILAYGGKSPTQLIVHESKNYKENKFKLGSNQMTQTWVYAYLFRMYQNFIKDLACKLQTKIGQLPQDEYDHIKILMQNIVENEDTLNTFIKLAEDGERDLPISRHKLLLKQMKIILNKEISKMKLNDYKSYFKDLNIIARGNSIFQCPLPTHNSLGFDSSLVAQPTYFLRRNLEEIFKVRGKAPQPKG